MQNLRALLEEPYTSNLAIKKPNIMQPKALFKSVSTAARGTLLSVFFSVY